MLLFFKKEVFLLQPRNKPLDQLTRSAGNRRRQRLAMAAETCRGRLAAAVTRFAVIRAVVSVSALGTWAAGKSYPMVRGGIIATAQVAGAPQNTIPTPAGARQAAALCRRPAASRRARRPPPQPPASRSRSPARSRRPRRARFVGAFAVVPYSCAQRYRNKEAALIIVWLTPQASGTPTASQASTSLASRLPASVGAATARACAGGM